MNGMSAMNGMSEEDLRRALDALNARLALETGVRLAPKEWKRDRWDYAAPAPSTVYICEIWLTGGLVREGPRWRAESRLGPETARRQAWEELLRAAWLPEASSGEELELKLSLLPDRDVRGAMRGIAYPERRRP